MRLSAEGQTQTLEEMIASTLQQFSACLHDKPVGAVRVSLALSSNEADIRHLIAVLARFGQTPVRDWVSG